MYLWNIKALRKDLKHGLSSKEDFKYLLGGSFFAILTLIPHPIHPTIYQTMSSIMGIIISIIMIIVLYRINGGEHGKNFLSRFISISFVTIIRSTVFLLIPLIIVPLIIFFVVYGKTIPQDSVINDVIGLVYSLGLYSLMIRSFVKLQKESRSE